MPKARKKSAAKKQLSQSERFIEAAKKSGADESGKTFESAFKTIVPKRDSTKGKR